MINDSPADSQGKPDDKPALRGDLTQGPIGKTLLMFSLPALITNVLQSLSGTVNSIWVGRLIGEEALAATANANIVMFLVSSLAFGFGMAGTVMIGQRWGARDVLGARRAFGTATGFASLLMLVIAILGFIGAPALLDAMATPGDAYGMALIYLRLLFVSMPFMMVSINLSMSLRGTGDAKTPLIFMLVTVVLDIVLNPLLIAGVGPFPAMGIAGSALATIIASTIAFIAMVFYVYAKDLPLRLRGRELAMLWPAKEELTYILTKGLPMGAQMLLMSASGIIMVRLVNEEGLLTTAAYAATMQLFTYMQMPAMAIGAAVSAMAAQYVGAGKWGGLDKVTYSGVWTNLVMTGSLCVLLLLFDRPVLVLFLGPDSPALPIAEHVQLISGWSFVFFGVTMVYTATMRAAGSVMIPLIIIAISLYPVRLGFYEATYHWLGADAIWWSFVVGAFAAMLLGWSYYHMWNWRGANAAPVSVRA